MRPLSPALTLELAKQTGAQLRPLLSITPPGGTTRYVSTQPLTPTNGQPHAGELIDLSPIDTSATGAGDLQVTLFDSAENRVAVRLGAEVRLRLYALGIDDSEADTVLLGTLSDPVERTGGQIRFDVQSMAERHNRLIGRPLSQAEFPGAVTPDVGKTLPNVIGRRERVEAVPVDAGAVTLLATDMDEALDYVDLVDGSAFPASGTIQIDIELMSYTGKDGNRLLGVTRGVTSLAADHAAGSNVAELQTEYDYLIADHAIQGASELYVEDVRQVGEVTTLASPISDTDTSLTIADDVLEQPQGSLKVGTEWMHYASVAGNTYSGLTRGVNGTQAQAHAGGTITEVCEWQVHTALHGVDLVTNGTFDTDTDWTKGDGWSIAGGVATCNGSQTAASRLSQWIAALDPGRQYLVELTVTARTAGTVALDVNGTSGTAHASTGTYTELLTCGDDAALELSVVADASFSGSVDVVIASSPWARLRFYTPRVLERLPSIELLDSIDVADPGHSHEGTSGSFTGTVASNTLPDFGTDPNDGLRSAANFNDDAGSYASRQLQDGQADARGDFLFNLSQTPNPAWVPLTATVEITAAISGGVIWLGQGYTQWQFGTDELFVSSPNINAGQTKTASKTASVADWSHLQQMPVRIVTPPTGGTQTTDVARYYQIRITDITYQEGGSSPANTGIAKVGTVSIAGSNTGSYVIGRTLACDVAGMVDDAIGSITGTPAALIEQPDHVVRQLLRQFGGAPGSMTSGADFDAFPGEALALAWSEPEQVSQALDTIRVEARAIVAYNGARWYMRLRPETQGDITLPDFALDDARVVRGEDGASSLTVGVIGLDTLTNRLHWTAGPRSDGGHEGAGTIEDTSSQGKYGVREAGLELVATFDAVQGETIANWHAQRFVDPERNLVALLVSLREYAIEIGDTVSLTSTKIIDADTLGEVTGVRVVLHGDGAGTVAITVEESPP